VPPQASLVAEHCLVISCHSPRNQGDRQLVLKAPGHSLSRDIEFWLLSSIKIQSVRIAYAGFSDIPDLASLVSTHHRVRNFTRRAAVTLS